MPIRVQNDLPAKEILERENIFVMDEHRAVHQDIRPLKIGLLNLMPLKEDTELQLLRSFSNTPLQERYCRGNECHSVFRTVYRSDPQCDSDRTG